MKLPAIRLTALSKPKESKLFLALLPTLKEKRTKQFTTLSLSFITIAFFGLFAISPTLGTIADLQKQLDDDTFVNQQLQKKIANLTTLQSAYSQIQPQLLPVLAAVPVTPAAEVLTGQIHQLASDAHIQLNRVQILPIDLSTKSTTPYSAYAFSVEAQADIASLQQFILALGSFNRLVTFDTIDYSRVGKVDPTFRLSIRGKAYFKQGV